MVLKNDLRYIKSEDAFKQAILELLEEQDKEKITISQLCERARCSRTAFYAHYTDKDQLYESIVDDFIAELQDVSRRYEGNPANKEDNFQGSSAEFFDTFMRNAPLLRTLLRGDRGTVQYLLIKKLTEAYMEEAKDISGRRQVNPQYHQFASYGAGGNVSFMLDCITTPGVDIEAARANYIDMQSVISEMAVGQLRAPKRKA